jgi:hypothetical protein
MALIKKIQCGRKKFGHNGFGENLTTFTMLSVNTMNLSIGALHVEEIQ